MPSANTVSKDSIVGIPSYCWPLKVPLTIMYENNIPGAIYLVLVLFKMIQ